MYTDFDLVVPNGLDEALEALAGAEEGACLPLAGGTNLLVDLRARRLAPRALVGLGRLPDQRAIAAADGRVTIGGGTTLTDLLRHPEMARWGASLLEAARVFAGQMVRNAATVAGNVAYGSPAADLVPPLLALDADVTLTSKGGSRTLPLPDFLLDYRKTARRPDELITAIGWPEPAGGSADCFYKLARRKGDAITVVGIGVGLTLHDGRCERARIALGAVAPTCRRAVEAEAMLEGERLTAELVDAAARHAAQEASPIDDIRASGEYRRHCVHVLVRRLLNTARERLA